MTIARALAAPSLAVCTLLDGQLIDPPYVQLVLGRNLYRSFPRVVEGGIPAQAVFVHTSGGQSPRQYHEDGSVLTANVMVHVRGNVNEFADGEDLARGVLAALHRNIPAGYIDCLSNVSEPEYGGPDNTENPVWIIPLSLTRTE